MRRIQAYQYELKPNGRQEQQMRRFAGARRFVFNMALALQEEKHQGGKKRLGYAALCRELTGWRRACDTAWLAEAPVHPLQQAFKDLGRAYKNFFAGRAEAPTFKKKGRHESFRYPDPKQFRLDQGNSRIFLPKLGWLRYRNSRRALGEMRNVTVSQSGGKWYVSVQTQREVAQPVPASVSATGIDVGIARFATLADGSFLAPLNSFKRHEAALRKAQQRVSCKVKFSSNWKKAKARVGRIHTRIGNVRRDFLHKASTTISQNHALVFVEDLQVRNLSASAKGTQEQHGKCVRAKAGLNRAILDQGWFEFRRQLDYKTAWNGGWLIAVPPQYTSQECPKCHHVSPANRKTQARFRCVACNFEDHADHVDALNILSRGMQMLRDQGQDTADASAGRETAARIACEVSGAVMPPAAGTHRSDSREALCYA